MGDKPTVRDAIVRRKLREVLNAAPGYGKTEPVLLERVNDLTGGGVDLDQLRRCLEWNHAREYVRTETDEDTDDSLWFITGHGQAKQRIK